MLAPSRVSRLRAGVPVNRMIAKLAAWHRAYLELQEARTRLKAAQARADDAARRELEAEVSRLQQESDFHLEELKGLASPPRRDEDQPGSDR
jgi:hypothetical protein